MVSGFLSFIEIFPLERILQNLKMMYLCSRIENVLSINMNERSRTTDGLMEIDKRT